MSWIFQEAANLRLEVGHFERDLIEGPRPAGGSLLVITDRSSRMTHIIRPKRKTAAEVHRATTQILRTHLVRTMTNDNGPEFGNFTRTERALKCPIFLTRPYASWERGTVENTNGLIRQYFHKQLKLKLKDIPDEIIAQVAKKLNHRPRKTLGFLTPIEFEAKKSKS